MKRVWCCLTVLALAAAAVSASATTARAQASCDEPGPIILTDPAGDATGMQPFHDVLSISVSQPSALGGNKFVFTLKMVGLPATPPNHVWPSLFTTPDGTPRFVRMGTDAAGVVTFAHGVGANPSPFAAPGTPADPASSFNADGTIRIVVAGSEIGDPAPGEFITGFLTRIREADSPGGALTPDNMPNSLIPEGEYEVVVCGTPVMGACCASNGSCSDGTNAACALAGGSFQGAGTTCATTTCPPPSTESTCIVPGLTVVIDATGDQDPNLGSRQSDIKQAWIAEPSSSGGLVVTMEVDSLATTAAGLPLNVLWTVLWTNPPSVPADPFPQKFVQMNTCDPTLLPTFAYGHVEGSIQSGEGNTTGTFNGSTGRIEINVPPSLVDSVGIGGVLGNVIAETRLLAGALCSGVIQTIDEASSGLSYTVVGPDYCDFHTVSCPAPDTDEPNSTVVVDFNITNPSTASRSYSVTVTDPEGWVVGGPITNLTVGPVPPMSSLTHSVTLQLPAACNPPINNLLTWTVTATDLPGPNNVASCQALVTCFRTTGVGDQAGAPLAIDMLGSNPFRGSTQFAYAVPDQGSVRIEVFSVTGQKVRTLVNREHEAGSYTVPFRLRDTSHRALGAGVYLVRITAGQEMRRLRVVALD